MNWFERRRLLGSFKVSTPKEAGHSHHGVPFSQDYVDANGRLIHAEWDEAGFWKLQDAQTGEPLGLHEERQLPDPNTFRPTAGAEPADTHHNDQLVSKLRDFLKSQDRK